MADKILIKINDGAIVQDHKGRLTGEVKVDEKEANRLVDVLKVASRVVKSQPSTQSSGKTDKTKENNS
jgi:hypothetical protein